MSNKFYEEWLSDLKIAPINGEYYTIEDEANAYFIQIILLTIMIVVYFSI